MATGIQWEKAVVVVLVDRWNSSWMTGNEEPEREKMVVFQRSTSCYCSRNRLLILVGKRKAKLEENSNCWGQMNLK